MSSSWFVVFGILLVTCHVHPAFGQDDEEDVDVIRFRGYKSIFNKEYSEDEEEYRLQSFRENLMQVQFHNALYEDGQTNFTMGTNEYSDMPHNEFVQRKLGFAPKKVTANSPLFKAYRAAKNIKQTPLKGPLPASVDWRKKGWVSSVKDQGDCGSCYTFSACGAIEGAYAKKYGKMIDCSEQNLLDCTFTDKYQNLGCDGGEMWTCFQYVKDNKGLESENSYNYFAEYTGACQYAAADKKISLSGYVFVPKTEAALKAAVAIQPIAVGIDAGPPSFQLYKSGIYYDSACSSTALNHAVVLVGYGTDASGKDYWLIKNSWGTSWGENGYMRIARNRKNHCGLASEGVYPIVA